MDLGERKYGFYLDELQGDCIALKSDDEGDTVIKLVVNRDYLQSQEQPLRLTRLLYLVMLEFIKQAQLEAEENDD